MSEFLLDWDDGIEDDPLGAQMRGEAYVTSNGAATSTETGGWSRVDLAEFIGLPAEEPQIAGVFYPGRRHLISGPGEAAKTWLCLGAAVAEIKDGRGVIWADLDGMGPREIASRLTAYGVTEDELAALVYFTAPEGELDDAQTFRLLEWARETGCRMLVSDAFTGFLVRHGLDGNVTKDVEQAWQILDPVKDAGLAAVLIDHVVKNAKNRKGEAIGSERKGTAAHLHFDLTPLEKFQRGGTGRSRIGVSRDRGAYFPRPFAGELVLHSDADTGAVTWTIEAPRTDGTFRPTHLMEKVSKFVEGYPDGVTKRTLEAGVKGNTDAKRLALELLITEGYVHRETGANRSQLHTSLKPYREDDEQENEL
jgi:hypothetical protein